MPLFTKESLEKIRSGVDLVEVVGKHLPLQPAGAAYKALCPFHDEKTPSFSIQRGDTHYHCFGCGAHGDAIQFLMLHQSLSFFEAVEQLGATYGIHLEYQQGTGQRVNTKGAKQALSKASVFYHTMLLYSEEGRSALQYLYQRGIDLDFICRFQVGLAPKQKGLFRQVMKSEGVSVKDLLQAGLLVERGYGVGDFFYDRITFPIADSSGAVIGFSARKYREETFGGKYVNTSETDLFKKSRILFGLHYSRRNIAKQKQALLVEGQVDTLRLIQEGIEIAVASQGTAFGKGHVQALSRLGVEKVWICFDSDKAGIAAAAKAGALFQEKGIGVGIVSLPKGEDPDSILAKEGPDAFLQRCQQATDYLPFLVEFTSTEFAVSTPAGKHQMIAKVAGIIREWENPVMVHESLLAFSRLVKVPPEIIGLQGTAVAPLRKVESVGGQEVDPALILDSDLLRWLLLLGEKESDIASLVAKNISPSLLQEPACKEVYQLFLDRREKGLAADLTHLSNFCETEEARGLLASLFQRPLNVDRKKELVPATIQAILERDWSAKKEALNQQLVSGSLTEEQALQLGAEFSQLQRNRPVICQLEEVDASPVTL